MRLTPNDRAILRELLGWSNERFPRGSLTVSAEGIATRTGLHRNTVLRRIQALQQGGVVDGYLFEPHPAPVGLVRAGHHFEGIKVADGDELATRLAPFPWVSIAILHMESCFLHTWHKDADEMSKDLGAVQEALQARQVIEGFRSDRWPTGAADRLVLSPLDRRILVALRRGARRSVRQVAEATGTTRRTVQRRIDRLAAAGAGAMIPIFRSGRIEGEVIAIFEWPHMSDDRGDRMRAAFPDRIMGPVDAGPRIMAMVPLSGLDEAARRRSGAEKEHDLDGLEMRFMRDARFPAACDAWLREHVQNAPPAAGKA